MVAFLRLFQHGEVSFHFVFLRERRAVNAGKHLVVLVAAPVRAGNAHQLERLDFARGRKVRSLAKVHEISLLVEGDFFAFGKIFDELHFVIFLEALHIFNGFFARQRESFDGEIALDDALHFHFYLLKIVHRDGRGEVYVVIKAVVDYGPDGKFAGRINGF